MISIEELAEMVGKESPVVRKTLLRLDNGMSGLHEVQNVMGRLLKKRKGIELADLGAFTAPDYHTLGSGGIPFARDPDSGSRDVNLQPALSNIGIFGPTSKGKTNALLVLASRFIRQGMAQVKIIDFLGNFSLLSGCCGHTVTLEVPSLNILHAKGVPGQRWTNVLFDLIAFHTGTMIGGRSFLNRIHLELARMFEGAGELYCLKDLTEYMLWLLRNRKLNQTDRQYCERIVGKLVSWDAESGGAFSCQRGMLDVMDSFNQVICLRGLSEELQRFYSGVLILRDFLERLFSPEESHWPLIYVIDEARGVFPNSDERSGIRSTILSTLTQTRNVGIWWWIATQEPSKLAHTCLANTPTKIVLGISEGLDLAVMQQSMRLNAAQVREISRFGESGMAVVKFSEGHTEPFVARIDLFRPDFSEEILESNRMLVEEARASLIPRSGLLEKLLNRERERERKFGKMSNPARRLFEAYGREPYKSLTELYEASGLGSKGSTAKKELATEGYIHGEDIRVKTRKGGVRYLLNPTEKGRNWLREAGIRQAVRGKGGPKELYYSLSIEKWAVQKGFSVRREYRGTDLLLESGNGLKVAVEIACRKDNQLRNIQRDLGLGIFGRIVVACESEKVLEQVREEFMASGISPEGCEVVFLPVTEIMT